jgi:predicted dehydrogenase
VAQGLATSWESAWRIQCENGSLLWDGHDGIRADIVGPPRTHLFDTAQPIPIPPLAPEDRIGGHLGVLRDFVDAVKGGTPPETRAEDNIKSLAMVMAATLSAESGTRVAVTV